MSASKHAQDATGTMHGRGLSGHHNHWCEHESTQVLHILDFSYHACHRCTFERPELAVVPIQSNGFSSQRDLSKFGIVLSIPCLPISCSLLLLLLCRELLPLSSFVNVPFGCCSCFCVFLCLCFIFLGVGLLDIVGSGLVILLLIATVAVCRSSTVYWLLQERATSQARFA